MAFGRNRQVEPFEPEHWDAITQFTVGRMMRRTVRKSTRGEGAHAVRFMRMRGGDEYMVPGVYIVPEDPAVALAKGGFRLFEDEAARQPLCTVLPDGSGRYRVTDPVGQDLGSVRRTSVTKRFSQHGPCRVCPAGRGIPRSGTAPRRPVRRTRRASSTACSPAARRPGATPRRSGSPPGPWCGPAVPAAARCRSLCRLRSSPGAASSRSLCARWTAPGRHRFTGGHPHPRRRRDSVAPRGGLRDARAGEVPLDCPSGTAAVDRAFTAAGAGGPPPIRWSVKSCDAELHSLRGSYSPAHRYCSGTTAPTRTRDQRRIRQRRAADGRSVRAPQC